MTLRYLLFLLILGLPASGQNPENPAGAASAAAVSVSAAKTSQTNAAKSASAAKSSETNAAKSAGAAKTSETSAAKSAGAAKTSQADAALSAGEAKASETKAAKAAAEVVGVSTVLKGVIGENGIAVGRAKVFDNRTLTLMLDTLSEALRGLQVIDQDPLKKALGLLQGSRIQDVSRSFSLLAGGTPKVETTVSGSTEGNLQKTVTTADGTKDDKKTEDYIEKVIDRKLNEKTGYNQVVTSSERNPSAPDLPELIAAPSSAPAFGQNPMDLLTDQVNLTYQIFNIRMLLERSLTDRLLPDANDKSGSPRLQTVLGFNVSLDPPRDAEQAAAIVEVTVQTADGKPASLVALMPQEKTYNSVALNSKSNAFGGSAVARMFTVGYTERRRGQIFYLFRDNDTLSFERMMTTDPSQLTFGWQFRPVLGRKSVAPGMRQMFAVLSLPIGDVGQVNAKLKVTVRTYWRKYYPDTLTSAEREKIGPWPRVKQIATLGTTYPIPNGKKALREEVLPADQVIVPTTARYQDDLKPQVKDVRWAKIDEKTALISVTGENFFTGTTVALGGSSGAANVILKSNQALDIVTPIDNIGLGDPVLIGRYGPSQPLIRNAKCGAYPKTGKLSLPFGGQRELDLTITGCPPDSLDHNLVIFANNKIVPGAVHTSWDTGELHVTASIPVELFPKTEGTITVVNPFRGAGWRVQFPWYENPYEVQRTLGSGNTTILFIHRKDGVPLVVLGPITRWEAVYSGQTITPTLVNLQTLRFNIPGADASGSVVLMEPIPGAQLNSTPYVLDLPAVQPKPKPAIEPTAATSLAINQNDAPKLEFTGEKIGDVATVKVEGKDPLKTEYDPDTKILSIFLTQEITKLPAKLALQFRDPAGKSISNLTLEIKSLPKPPAPATKPSGK